MAPDDVQVVRTTTSFLHLTARSGVRDVFSDGQIARWFECRAGLSEDPLRARWSAYSDVMGASARPMISAEELAAILGRPRRGFRDWFHQYVSADPTTDLAGTPTPTAIPSGFLPSGGLRDLARAAAASARAPVAAIRSRGLGRQPV